MFYMCGIDRSVVSLEILEGAALSDEDIRKLTEKIMNADGVDACMLLSTCNRTELYVSGDNVDVFSAYEYISPESKKYRICLEGEEVIRHLFETACGLNSLIKRETQIISQLNHAAKTARKYGSLDPKLEVLTRLAVTAAKKAAGAASADVRLSSAQLAAEWLENEYGSLYGKKVLVTGNGNVGRLMANIMLKKGAEVTVTVRLYKNGVIPCGCASIPYENRYGFKADIIVSATKSPNFTYNENEMIYYPEYFVDLAVPRDISPELRERYGEKYRCIDDFAVDNADNSEVFEIIDDGIKKYHEWENCENTLPLLDEMKDIMIKRLCASDGYDEYEITNIVGRVTDMLVYGLKETVNEENMNRCLERLIRRARL
ncbi:MAG: hypothetical protein IJ583_11935 [Firmicutes bacterium]|nr:hypothetical protein [Bacillota bacterium]